VLLLLLFKRWEREERLLSFLSWSIWSNGFRHHTTTTERRRRWSSFPPFLTSLKTFLFIFLFGCALGVCTNGSFFFLFGSPLCWQRGDTYERIKKKKQKKGQDNLEMESPFFLDRCKEGGSSSDWKQFQLTIKKTTTTNELKRDVDAFLIFKETSAPLFSTAIWTAAAAAAVATSCWWLRQRRPSDKFILTKKERKNKIYIFPPFYFFYFKPSAIWMETSVTPCNKITENEAKTSFPSLFYYTLIRVHSVPSTLVPS